MTTPGTRAAPYAPFTTQTANADLDTWLPGGGRTVTNIPTYLSHNAVFNVKDFGATGNGTTDDAPSFLTAIAAANANGGGFVFVPQGVYAIGTQLVLPAGVSMRGVGMGASASNSSRLKWLGAGDFCLKAGNTASALSRGISIEDLGINLNTLTGHGIWLYGASQCCLRNVYIEGKTPSTTSIAVQIDGANVSAFFITMQNVVCNHVFKGFVHTSTGTTVPTQVTAIGCSAFCDNTAGSIGLDVQTVGAGQCGDGVVYVGANFESCATGANLTAYGTSLIGCRFENQQGVASDVTFASGARGNQVIGGNALYTVTDAANDPTNQVVGVARTSIPALSQSNLLDNVTVGKAGNVSMQPNGTTTRFWRVLADATYAGKVVMQAGQGSAGMGGAVNLYGHAHATHPGDIVAGISSGSGGKFRVNSQALDAGTDQFVVDPNGTGVSTILGFQAATVKATGAFGCNGAAPQAAAASGGAVTQTAGATYTATEQAMLASIKALVNTIRATLVANGQMS